MTIHDKTIANTMADLNRGFAKVDRAALARAATHDCEWRMH